VITWSGNKAISQHISPICLTFGLAGLHQTCHHVGGEQKRERTCGLSSRSRISGSFPRRTKHEIGIQRVQSWLYTQGSLFFAYTACSNTIEQMRAYRYAEQRASVGPATKKTKEEVFKFKDELPDGVRYAMMAWPELPAETDPTLTPAQEARWDAMDERTRLDIERWREYASRGTEKDLTLDDANYPIGEMYGADTTQDAWI
jgi:hypothetical protein